MADFPDTDISPGVLEHSIAPHGTPTLAAPPGRLSTRVRSERKEGHGNTWNCRLCQPTARSVAFAWAAMDALDEEDERILGHAADSYHRIDIRQTSRSLVVRHHDRVVANSSRPTALYESGFAPRWYVPRADIDDAALNFVEHQTFCPYKGLCSYYDIGDARLGAWSYRDAYPEVGHISGRVSFEPGMVSVSPTAHPSNSSRVKQ